MGFEINVHQIGNEAMLPAYMPIGIAFRGEF